MVRAMNSIIMLRVEQLYGKVKRKQAGLRHRLKSHNSKLKRHLGDTTYVHSANMNQARRLLNF